MRLENVMAVVKREYLQRIRSKGFWLGTLLVPVFVGLITVLPGLLIAKTQARQTLVVVDESGTVAAPFVARVNDQNKEAQKETQKTEKKGDNRAAEFQARSEPVGADREAQRKELNRRVQEKEIDAWLWVPAGVFEDQAIEYHARSVSNLFTQDALRDELTWVVRRERLQRAGIDPERVDALTRQVKLEGQKVSAEGSRAESGVGGMFFGVGMFMILYFAMLLWGQQVMSGVLEEKGSRVIEVLISSITAFELMMGKLVGICLVGLTQLSIWLGTVAVLTAPGILASLALLPPEVKLPTLTVGMLIHFILLFILGFFAFATIYATIGASFNNLQEAQQAASVAVIFIVIPAMVMWPVINDPNSTMATVLSLIPLFTPLLMPLRIAIEMPPVWQIALAYAMTISFVVGMVWFGSKIYRIGILMYGKKPTFQEIWKWTKYA